MTKLIVKFKAYPKEIVIFDVTAGFTAAALASSLGVTNPNLYEEVADDAFTDEEFFIRDGFDVSNGVATFSLADAKASAIFEASVAYSISMESASSGISPATMLAQFSLPAQDRNLDIQAVFDGVNAEVSALTAAQQSINNAVDITALKSVVDSLPAIITEEPRPIEYLASGILFTGRGSGLGPEDLNISYYTEFFSASLDESETEIYVPSVNGVIAYGSGGKGKFDSAGNVFNEGGPYTVQIRETSTSKVIAEIVVPLNASGEGIEFNIPA